MRLALLALLPLLFSCKVEQQKIDPSSTISKPAAAPVRGARMLSAGATATDVAALVRDKRDAESSAGRALLVYVGATWCEPCQKFHQEVASGQLDEKLPNVTFLEFDADRDRAGLSQAGYVSDYVPLIARPNADGRASGEKVAGIIKGHDPAVDLVDRIQSMATPR